METITHIALGLSKAANAATNLYEGRDKADVFIYHRPRTSQDSATVYGWCRPREKVPTGVLAYRLLDWPHISYEQLTKDVDNIIKE